MMRMIHKLLVLVSMMILSLGIVHAAESNAGMQLSSSPEVMASLAKVAVGLFLVVIAIFVSAWFYRRFGQQVGVSSQALKLIGGISLGNRERVVLMKVGDQQILLGITPGQIQKLHVLEHPIECQVDTEKDKQPFVQQLNQYLKKKS